VTVERPWRALTYSRSEVGSHGIGIKKMVTLSAWKCGSHLYGPQELEVYLYPTRFEHEAKKMARVDQRLQAADALSHKVHCIYLPAVHLTREESSTQVLPNLSLFNITLTLILRDEIITAQKNDEGMAHIKRRIQECDPKVTCFCEDAEGVLWFKNRLVVPKKATLKNKILHEAHNLRYSIHPSSTNMYHDLRQQLYWTRMKHEIAHYVSECDTCRKVKAVYMKPRGLLQPLSVLDWKWDDISMDFIVGL
jgi:hypothetical protein